jgi:peptide/nickel transport system permease protein
MSDVQHGLTVDALAPTRPTATQRGLRWRPPLSAAVIAALAFVVLLCIAVAAPQSISFYDPLRGNFLQSLQPPSAAHWFGTDRLGRDVLSRVVYGARYSLLIGVSAMLISVAGGVVLGVFAGLRNRFVDEAISRVFDVLSAFPSVLLALLVVVFLGASMVNVAIAIGLSGIPKFGRVVRARTRLVREADYVTHAFIYGRTRASVFLRHLLPNVLTAVPVIATLDIGTAILAVSALSFLGLGPQPPTPEWGVMLAESRDVLRVAWWPSVFPGLALTATVIAFTLIGRALQAHFERRAR